MKENSIEEDIKIIEYNMKCIRNVMNNFEDELCENMQTKTDEVSKIIYNILSGYKRVLKENKELKEYIMLAPNLDEMTATKYKNIQEEAYIRGRVEEQKKAEQIIYENYIPVQKVKEKIEELNQEDREWTEELSEPDSNFKIIDRNLKRIKNQIEILKELLEGRK